MRAVLAAGVAAGLLWPSLATTALADDEWNGPPKTPGPCTLSWVSKTSEPDPDLDVTRTVVHLSANALRVTVHMAQLADHPENSTGHKFVISIGFKGRYDHAEIVQAEYSHDTVSGDSTYDPDNRYVHDLRGTSVRFDTERSEVVARIPRRALYAQMLQPKLEPTIIFATVNSLRTPTPADGGGADNTWAGTRDQQPLLSFARCDEHLGVQPTRAPLDPSMNHVRYPNACTAEVSDPLGDGQDVVADRQGESVSHERRDLDIRTATFHYGPRVVRVVMDVPEIADHPSAAWKQVFGVGAHSTDPGESGPPFDYVGYQRSAAGTAPMGKGPLVGGGVDELHHRVVFRLKVGVVERAANLYVFSRDDYTNSTDSPTSFDFTTSTAGDDVNVWWIVDPTICR